MKQLLYEIYFTRCQVSAFFCSQLNVQGNRVNCKNIMPLIVCKIFHSHFTSLTMIQIFGRSPILTKHGKIFQRNSTNCSWNFSNINFYFTVKIIILWKNYLKPTWFFSKCGIRMKTDTTNVSVFTSNIVQKIDGLKSYIDDQSRNEGKK